MRLAPPPLSHIWDTVVYPADSIYGEQKTVQKPMG